ncbi:hypothetical protein ACCAA_770014 [Candidatus Accumulibacter aalborgensis]|uniref:Uncharacterized protein n=1 Tax=Candidatus Accumulibacter aalborgensis TaxID=1860102 RepID=A0A1A8XXT5_9PROT|nr:hypothetical protein ACCAA_770014 [Candidatus Accumulibacter aalborgensis]
MVRATMSEIFTPGLRASDRPISVTLLVIRRVVLEKWDMMAKNGRKCRVMWDFVRMSLRR